MKVPLDTHILLWWLSGDRALPPAARQVVASESNVVFVSAATAREIVIKKALGKLEAPDDLETAIRDSRLKFCLSVLRMPSPPALLPSIMQIHSTGCS